MNKGDIENVYNLMENLLIESKAINKLLKEKKSNPKTENVINEKLLLEIKQTVSNQQKNQDQFLSSIGKQKQVKSVESVVNNNRHFSILGDGNVKSLRPAFVLASTLTFMYFLITFCVGFLSNQEELIESNRIYKTFYDYHYYQLSNDNEEGKILYLDSTISLITNNDLKFLKDYKERKDQYYKELKKKGLEKELIKLENDNKKQ